MELGMDTRVSTIELTLLSWRLPHGFLAMQAFSGTPAPWVLSWKSLKMLFSSACSATDSLTFGYGLVLFKVSMRNPEKRQDCETDGMWQPAGGGWYHWSETAWHGKAGVLWLYQTLAVRTGYKWLMIRQRSLTILLPKHPSHQWCLGSRVTKWICSNLLSDANGFCNRLLSFNNITQHNF